MLQVSLVLDDCPSAVDQSMDAIDDLRDNMHPTVFVMRNLKVSNVWHAVASVIAVQTNGTTALLHSCTTVCYQQLCA